MRNSIQIGISIERLKVRPATEAVETISPDAPSWAWYLVLAGKAGELRHFGAATSAFTG